MLRLSICITTYNRGSTLAETLRTVLNQSYKDFEVVVIDDASTDETPEVVCSIGDARLRYTRNAVNVGLIANKNRAIEEAKGDVIAIYHDHDLYHPDLVRRSMEILDEYPKVGAVCAAAHIVNADDPTQILSTIHLNFGEVTPGATVRRALFHHWRCKIVGPTTMVRRSCYEQLGVFNPEYGGAADRDFWLRVFRYWDLGYIAEPMARLRQRRIIARFSAAEADAHWHELECQIRIQQLHLERHFHNRPVLRCIERQRLKMMHFSEFWRWACWLLAKRNNPEFSRAALFAFRATGLNWSAGIIQRLEKSSAAAGMFSAALQVYRALAVRPARGALSMPAQTHNAGAE